MTRARGVLWLVLAMPAAIMAWQAGTGARAYTTLLQPSGEVSLVLVILALLPGPLAEAFGRSPVLRAWLAIRRNLGIAGFGYAALHLLFYIGDMGALAAMLDELALPAIWTGWLALAFLLAAASISTDRAMRRLGRRWKQVQRGVYAALLLALAHWALIDRAIAPALWHLAPLLAAWGLRSWARFAKGSEWKRTQA